ncbi:MAG: Clp protease ClpS, partial [Microcystaceae cyanobacterium]
MQVTAVVSTPERSTSTVRKSYPQYKVIVLNDDFNTF